MTIKYNDRIYDAADNGDGTFTLTPTAPAINASVDQLRREYRDLRSKAVSLLDHRDQVNAKLQALKDRRDELKALILASGVDPDVDPEPEA
jgi:hypothetical protein